MCQTWGQLHFEVINYYYYYIKNLSITITITMCLLSKCSITITITIIYYYYPMSGMCSFLSFPNLLSFLSVILVAIEDQP